MRYLHLLFVPILSYTQISISTTNLPKELEETSGLEFYGENYITHNDSGDKAKVYVFNSKGKIVKSIRLYDLKNEDWEDITADSDHYYIADTGNNKGNRKNLKIYILSSNFDLEGEINIKYKGQNDFTERAIHPFDAEALTVYGDSLLLFSKNRKTLKSEIYIFPKTTGNYNINPQAVLNVNSLITAADYNEEYDLLVLTGENFVGDQFFYSVTNFKKNGWRSFNLIKYKIPIGRAQIEAVKIINENKFILTSEKVKNKLARFIFLVIDKKVIF